MSKINIQSFTFKTSGKLSGITGPNGLKPPSAPASSIDIVPKIRIMWATVTALSADAEAIIYDDTTGAPQNEIWRGQAVKSASFGQANLGIKVISGDFYVQIIGSAVLTVGIDLNK